MKRNCLQKLLLAAAVFFFVSAPAAVLAANAAPTPAPTVSISTDSDFTIDGSALIKYNGKASFATVPKGVRVIRGGAFAGNKTITTVYLPDSVEEIEGGAFENCSNLQTVVTSGNSKLSAIGSSAFSGCPKLNTAFAFDVGSVSDSALTQHTNAPKASPKPTPAVKATALPAARPTAAVSASPIPASSLAGYDDFKIIMQPLSVPAAAGDPVSFSVLALCDGDVQYQWLYSRDGSDWPEIKSNSSTFHGAATNELSFMVSPANAKYSFRCRVSDGSRVLISNIVSVLPVNGSPAVLPGYPAETADDFFGAPSTIGAWQETDTSVTIIWAPVEMASSYELYRSDNGGAAELIAVLTDYSYLDTGLDLLGNNYSYAVAAVTQAEGQVIRSELSDEVQAEKLVTVQNGIELDGVGYIFTADGAVVIAYKGTASNLIIPASVQKGNLTYPVIGIGPNVFRGNKTLKTISLPNTIRVIETGAFAYCNAMIDH